MSAVTAARLEVVEAVLSGPLSPASGVAMCWVETKDVTRARRMGPRLLPAAWVDPAEGAFAWCVT
jgi:hypothetical protein